MKIFEEKICKRCDECDKKNVSIDKNS